MEAQPQAMSADAYRQRATLNHFASDKPTCIYVTVTGPVGSGKSAIAASIKVILEHHGFCVAVPDRAERLNPSNPLDEATAHEKPKKDRTVIVLSERVE